MGVNLKPQLESMPQLTARYNELVKTTSDAEALENRQAQLKADLQEVNRQRRDIFKSGEELRNRIGAVLKAEHGFTSERLLEFGLKPKRARGRAKKTPTPATPTTTTTTTTPTAK
jgi:chromosome segregation ATPase